MKTFRLVGWCAIVELSFCCSTVTVRANEGEQTPAAAEGVPAAPPSMCRCEGDLGPSVERIKRALAGQLHSTGLEFSDEPLENVVNFLQEDYGIPIQLDQPALDDAGLTRDLPITVNLNHITFSAALRLLLKREQLVYVIRDEVLVITTPEEAESELVACVYDVRDLIGENKKNKEIESLVDVIVSCVASETWAVSGGGEAEIKTLRPGLLVISQTGAVHEEIGNLLALIRETLRQPITRPAGEATGMMGGRGGYGMSREGMEGGEGGYGGGRGGPGGEMGAEPTPAEATPFD